MYSGYDSFAEMFGKMSLDDMSNTQIQKKIEKVGDYHINLIYYDESMEKSEETHSYFKFLKNNVQGVYFACHNFDSFQKICRIIKQLPEKPKFILMTSGSTAEKIYSYCLHENCFQEAMIFCFYREKYLPLMKKYSKLKAVCNDFFDVQNRLKNMSTLLALPLKATKLILIDEYFSTYVQLHKKIANQFASLSGSSAMSKWKSQMKDFNKYLKETTNGGSYINDITNANPTVANFIKYYTGEKFLCYELNKRLRDCDPSIYDKIAPYTGHFSYALHEYARKTKQVGVYENKVFYRRITLTLADLFMYEACVGDVICYPAFTSVSSIELNKYIFPTELAMQVNKIEENDINVVMNFNYKYRSGCITPAICLDDYSVNEGEMEYVFPPFSFFKITKLELYAGTHDNPHVIYLDAVAKPFCTEDMINKGRTFKYDSYTNSLVAN